MEELGTLLQVAVQVPAVAILGYIFLSVFRSLLNHIGASIDKMTEALTAFAAAMLEVSAATRENTRAVERLMRDPQQRE